jgi:hypothetical protein
VAAARSLFAGMFLFASVAVHAGSAAQRPLSLSRADLLPEGAVQIRTMPAVDVAALLLEDQANRDLVGVPYRVGYPMASDLSPATAGTWEDVPGGGRVWRLRVRSPGALWTALGFGTYRLQPGAKFWVYDPQRREVLGPYESDDVRSHGQLWLPPVQGDTAVLELYWPEELGDTVPNIHLGTVSHGYKSWDGYGEAELGSGASRDELESLASGSCNIDVNCPLGDDWQAEKRSVARMLTGGAFLCTGALVNTTAGDCHPYFLTANHCIGNQSEAASTVFRFNYERPNCGSGSPATNDSISGSTLVATYAASDVALVELSSPPVDWWDTYFAGWTRSALAATESTGIHHPSGDYKKIAYDADTLVSGVYYGADHWRINQWEQGTTEGGSSGSPLFDQNHRIVGQLHGGTASCTSLTWDEYGKFSYSWTGAGTPATRLSDWLDPVDSGAISVEGKDHALCLSPQPVLVYTSHTVQEILGNGDGIPDPGETLFVQVNVENTGNVTATEVTGVLSSPSSWTGLSGDVAQWPDIPEGELKTSGGPGFHVQLDPAYACGDPVQLHLDLTAAETTDVWTADFEFQTGTLAVNEMFRDDMEAGTGGWTSESLLGTESWSLVTTDSHSPTHSWFIADTLSKRDTVLVMETLFDVSPDAVLSFAHRFDTEANKDGGVLEYSTDGGSNWYDAGALIAVGAYNSTIGDGENSNLAGRDAWTGDSGGWISVELPLSSLAGTDLSLRWRFATNLLFGDLGWYVDDVVVADPPSGYACDVMTDAPGEAGDPLGAGSAFTMDKNPGGYELSWSAPESGGAAMSYVLYRAPLGAAVTAPTCEADLGTGTSVVLPSLSDDFGFIVVARNSLAEGSYGLDSLDQPRTPAQGAAICP